MKQLTTYEARYIVDEINQYIAIIRFDHTLSYANAALLNFSGVKYEHVENLPYWELPWWDSNKKQHNKLIFAVERAFFGETVRFDTSYLKYDGTIHEIDFILKPLYKRNQIEAVIATGYNITDFVKSQKALTKYQRQLDAFFNSSSDGYFFYMLDEPISLPKELSCADIKDIITHQNLSFYNRKLEQITYQTITMESDIYDILPEDNATIEKYWTEMLEVGKVKFDTKITVDIPLVYEDDQENDYDYFNPHNIHLRIVLVAIFNEINDFEGNFAIVRDRTQEVRNMKRLEFLANKDPLTKIDNRRSFYTNAISLLQENNRIGKPITVAMIDIDFFKRINDTYGHEAGDVVLYHFAQLIRNTLDDDDVVARYGGEEFVVLINETQEVAMEALEELRIAISNMMINYDNQIIKLTASIGLRANINMSENIDTLIAEADHALYHSKKTGRNKVSCFSEITNE